MSTRVASNQSTCRTLGCDTVTVLLPPPRAQRVGRLLPGLVLYGVSDGMILLAGLGVDPWDVFHQGLSRRLGLGVGTWAVIVGLIVLALWIPLRQKPGVGTVCNVVVVGTVIDVVLAVFSAPHQIAVRWALMLAGVVLNAVATAAYIGAGLGPGPRDGLMTGLAARGHSVRIVRTAIELTVLATGWLLGGTVGIGTVIYALSIGPLAHYFLPRLAIDSRPTQSAQQSTSSSAEPSVAAVTPGGGPDGT
jgi:uncharacterized membrane protein YczE